MLQRHTTLLNWSIRSHNNNYEIEIISFSYVVRRIRILRLFVRIYLSFYAIAYTRTYIQNWICFDQNLLFSLKVFKLWRNAIMPVEEGGGGGAWFLGQVLYSRKLFLSVRYSNCLCRYTLSKNGMCSKYSFLIIFYIQIWSSYEKIILHAIHFSITIQHFLCSCWHWQSAMTYVPIFHRTKPYFEFVFLFAAICCNSSTKSNS